MLASPSDVHTGLECRHVQRRRVEIALERVAARILQELALALPNGLRFRAKGGIGDRTGLSVARIYSVSTEFRPETLPKGKTLGLLISPKT